MMTAPPEQQYWLERGGEVRGPYTFEALVTMWDRKELRLTDRLRTEGTQNWLEVSRLMKSLDQAARSQSDQARNPPSFEMRVVITDIRMRFSSMVIFMVKWAFAAIPAIIIIYLIIIIIVGLLSHK
jgi:GYF domain 2